MEHYLECSAYIDWKHPLLAFPIIEAFERDLPEIAVSSIRGDMQKSKCVIRVNFSRVI